MLRIKQMHVKDIPFAIRLTDQEEWGITRSALQRLMRLNPRGCFIAYEGSKRLGITTTTVYDRKLAWIGNVIVDKDHRGRQIGHALVEHAASSLRKSSVGHIALYCYKEHVKFYENLGFLRNRSFVRLRRNARRVQHVTRWGDFRRPLSLVRLLAADKEAFGADRSELIRAFLAEKAAWYLGSSRGISSTSYLMVKEYLNDCEFGPWICINPLPDEPREMIERALSKIKPVPVEISCLRENWRALQLLKKNKFRKIREGYRMIFEERAHIGSDSSQYALGFLDKG
jgi:ribosomal protein S18 acetylase RimI-like enzyme